MSNYKKKMKMQFQTFSQKKVEIYGMFFTNIETNNKETKKTHFETNISECKPKKNNPKKRDLNSLTLLKLGNIYDATD